ncbi:MAG: ABC transporter ATP-binding protein [Proteobacteria bacterium]|nr:MAG: ABC transporter ATP-binding protein [Pseudomonadota bacterium]
MKPEPILQFRGLRKFLANRWLLDISELSISAGQCMILSGDNGVGKTTLLKIMAGLEPPDAGEVSYDGKVLPLRTAPQQYRDNIVYLHQSPYLFDCSVIDNVAYGLRRRRMPRAAVQAKVAEVLEWAGLEHLGKRNAKYLSGGEKQRVALARARVLAPKVLLLDEPIASMDYKSRERTYVLIERLKKEGMSVVITSHELSAVLPLADVHMYLRDGKLHDERQDNTAAQMSWLISSENRHND